VEKNQMQTVANPWLWGGFVVVVIAALLADLVLMRHGGAHKVSFKEALWWSIAWVTLALAFNAGLWWYLHQTLDAANAGRIGLEFLTGYLVEKSLAVDNIFVFLLVMNSFALPEEQRQRVLVIGVLGAIVLRAVMIFAGAALLTRFHWLLYVFGAFLLLTGIRMWFSAGSEPDLEANPVLKYMRRHLRLTEGYVGHRLAVGGEGPGRADHHEHDQRRHLSHRRHPARAHPGRRPSDGCDAYRCVRARLPGAGEGRS